MFLNKLDQIMISLDDLSELNSTVVSIGNIFGRLLVTKVLSNKKTRRCYVICDCECGTKGKIIRFDAISAGKTLSCGCYHAEVSTTHGLTNSEHYKRWSHMMSRCYNTRDGNYKLYGGRGISVFSEWHDVAKFVEALPNGFSPGMEIDRINNDGNYEPGNIRWVSCSDNCDNRRSGRKITFNGKTQSLNRWAKELGINEGTLRSRIDDSNWTLDKALTTPIMDSSQAARQNKRWEGHTAKPKKTPRALLVKRFNVEGEMLSIREISDKTGLSIKLLTKRLCERGWSIDKALRPKE